MRSESCAPSRTIFQANSPHGLFGTALDCGEAALDERSSMRVGKRSEDVANGTACLREKTFNINLCAQN